MAPVNRRVGQPAEHTCRALPTPNLAGARPSESGMSGEFEWEWEQKIDCLRVAVVNLGLVYFLH